MHLCIHFKAKKNIKTVRNFIFLAFSGRRLGHISNIRISYGYLGIPGLRWSFPLFKIPPTSKHLRGELPRKWAKNIIFGFFIQSYLKLMPDHHKKLFDPITKRTPPKCLLKSLKIAKTMGIGFVFWLSWKFPFCSTIFPTLPTIFELGKKFGTVLFP